MKAGSTSIYWHKYGRSAGTACFEDCRHFDVPGMVCLSINWVICKGIRRPKGDAAAAGSWVLRAYLKTGLLPVIQSRALIERTVRGTAFDKNSQLPCIKIEKKTPDKTSRLATTFVRHMLFSLQHTFTHVCVLQFLIVFLRYRLQPLRLSL